MAYENLSKFYDSLIKDFPHGKIFCFLEKKMSFSGKKVLDLCCGTGKALLEIENRNGKAIGLDYSEEMLNKAKENLRANGSVCPLIFGDINALKLDRKFDIITMICDGLNYLKQKNLSAFLDNIDKMLEQDGIFICEFSTLYKAENILADELYYEDNENLTYFFANKYNKKSKYVDIYLTIFEKIGELYSRYDDIQRQYFFDLETLKKSFEERFSCSYFDSLTQKSLSEDSERILILAKKRV